MLIGLGYRMQTGKDTIASYLVEKWGFKRIAFADPLKRACMAAFGFSEEQVFTDLKKEVDQFWGKSPGHFLQVVGTELFREKIDEDFWIKRAFREISEDPNGKWVISDVRFPNEAIHILDVEGYVFRVDRSAASDINRKATHKSETSMDEFYEWTGVINNDGTFDELYQQVDWICERLITDRVVM